MAYFLLYKQHWIIRHVQCSISLFLTATGSMKYLDEHHTHAQVKTEYHQIHVTWVAYTTIQTGQAHRDRLLSSFRLKHIDRCLPACASSLVHHHQLEQWDRPPEGA